jgi:hypothetical protein
MFLKNSQSRFIEGNLINCKTVHYFVQLFNVCDGLTTGIRLKFLKVENLAVFSKVFLKK